jgi:hypothetical protein
MLALVACFAGSSAVALAQESADAPAEAADRSPEAVFDQHAASGTLFLPQTAQQFRQNGWGKEYAALIRDKWQGSSHAGMRVSLKPLPDHAYRVGQPFDCLAAIKNEGEKPQKLDVGGSCGMTHALGLMVIPPDGGIDLGWARGKVGGSHCFCQSRFESVEPGRSAALQTGFATSAAVNWKPAKPGVHLVIATYAAPAKAGAPDVIYSAPLAIEVEGMK